MHQEDIGQITLRLIVALLIGATIGVERHVRGQAAGLRTHALVSMAAALAVLIVAPLSASGESQADAQSRVLQGVLTGIGFLGAGVILHSAQKNRIYGLTSAAVIWITAVFGALCGHGRIDIALLGFVMIMFVMLVGGHIEDAIRQRFPKSRSENQESDPPENQP
jgi:putative Mg2+ transporter-C (MgtC) family protein